VSWSDTSPNFSKTRLYRNPCRVSQLGDSGSLKTEAIELVSRSESVNDTKGHEFNKSQRWNTLAVENSHKTREKLSSCKSINKSAQKYKSNQIALSSNKTISPNNKRTLLQ
jgi:hypothetical protein